MRGLRVAAGIGLVLITVGTAACFSEVLLADYRPRSRAERQIKAVLLEYLSAKRQFDIERYLAGLHADGHYHFECGRMLSKADLGYLLPEFWVHMRSGDPSFYPINRECITGDYFETGRYVDPRIDVDGTKAGVALRFTVGWWSLAHYVSLVKEDDRWIINRLGWEMN